MGLNPLRDQFVPPVPPNMDVAQNIWSLFCLFMALDFAGAGVLDIGLYVLRGASATLTAYLRSNPSAFYWPAGLLVGGVVLLWLHLFVEPLFWK